MDLPNLVLPLLVSGAGVGLAGIAHANRNNPGWRPYIGAIYIIAIGQVIFGIVFWLLVNA